MVLSFDSVDEILKCDHSNESYWAVLSCGAVYYAVAVQAIPSSKSLDKSLKLSVSPFHDQMEATEQYFPVVLFISKLRKMVVNFEY